MYVRKRRNKWQCLVRHKGHRVAQSFSSKSDASLWGHKVESELMKGTYQNNDKLVQMTLKDLLQLYLEKAMHKSKRPKILKYDVSLCQILDPLKYNHENFLDLSIAYYDKKRHEKAQRMICRM